MDVFNSASLGNSIIKKLTDLPPAPPLPPKKQTNKQTNKQISRCRIDMQKAEYFIEFTFSNRCIVGC